MCRSISAAAPPSRLGKFGGHAGRALRVGDVLKLAPRRFHARAAGDARDRLPHLSARVGVRRDVRPARRARFLHRRRHRDVLRRRLGGALQLGAHRRAAGRAEAAMGAHGWRRGRAASVQHSRQRLRDRRDRFHRRHADHPRPGRTEPRRVRLPGRRGAGGALESRPAAPRRSRALSLSECRASRGSGGEAGSAARGHAAGRRDLRPLRLA